MSDFTLTQTGIYQFSNGSIAVLAPNLVLVGWGSEPMTMSDMDHVVKYLKSKFEPEVRLIVFNGPLTYTALSASKDLRNLIADVIKETISV